MSILSLTSGAAETMLCSRLVKVSQFTSPSLIVTFDCKILLTRLAGGWGMFSSASERLYKIPDVIVTMMCTKSCCSSLVFEMLRRWEVVVLLHRPRRSRITHVVKDAFKDLVT